jgi:hypothetical protein
MIDAYQQTWMIILIPVFLVYGFIEVRRGWSIIKRGEKSHNIAVQTRIWLIKHFAGKKKSIQYRKSLEQDKEYMTRAGLYSLIGGIVSIAISIMWIVVLYLNTRKS